MAQGSLIRAETYLQMRQFAVAESELRRVLASSISAPDAHSLLALALLYQNKLQEAVTEAHRGVSTDPNSPYAHYVLGILKLAQKSPLQAEQSFREAIRLNPHEVRAYALLADCLRARDDFNGAIKAAREGLAINPNHSDCLQTLAIAQLGVRQYDLAGETVETLLRVDPQSADAHVIRAVIRVERRDYKAASADFREALRIDPNSKYAQEMLIETMKARNPIYALVMNYFRWMSGMPGRTRWLIVIGGVIGLQFIARSVRDNPAAQPFFIAALTVYLTFVFLTWTAVPLFDLVLRLDRFGSLILPKPRKIASNWVGLALLTAAALLIAGLTQSGHAQTRFLLAAAQTAGLIIPLAGIFTDDLTPNNRLLVIAWTAALAILILLGFTYTPAPGEPFSSPTVSLYILGLLAYTWAGQLILNRETNSGA